MGLNDIWKCTECDRFLHDYEILEEIDEVYGKLSMNRYCPVCDSDDLEFIRKGDRDES